MQRKVLRLKGYNYSESGTYFVSIGTNHRKCLFGEIVSGQMVLNDFGKIVEGEWERSAGIRAEIKLDAFVVMPNHLHGIVSIVGATSRLPLQAHCSYGLKPRSLGSFIAGFKASATKQIAKLRNTLGKDVWQRGYYDRIIRNEKELLETRKYILENPIKWQEDSESVE